MRTNRHVKAILGAALVLLGSGTLEARDLVLTAQGSFAVGGTVKSHTGTFDPIRQGAYNPNGVDSKGQSLHGDHAYVFYQIPKGARKLPLVFWHGHGQSSKTWETTPDGREGFQNLFLRRDWSVYLVGQPRRGKAARSTEPVTIPAVPDEPLWFGIFRLGAWPDFYPGVQFSRDPQALDQFWRQGVPNSGPYDPQVNVAAFSALFDTVGDGILVTHSQSGGPGWATAMKDRHVKAVVSLEPGGDFPFPEGEKVDPIVLSGRTIPAQILPMEQFKALTRIPIVIYYGDNIPDSLSQNPGKEQWRQFLLAARRFQTVVNKHGGDVKVVHLPEVGIEGNTHMLMSDLNNVQVADHIAGWLKSKELDRK